MSKLLRQNVGGTDFTMAGCTLTGVCNSAASDYVKAVTLTDGDTLSDGMTIVVEFANGNTTGTAPASLAIYSSDQINYFSDSGLTQPFTLAPSGCYEIEYTGTGNAYTYISYPVMQVGSVSGPLCDSCGRKASGALWFAEDKVSINYSNGCFNVLPQVTDALTFMASSSTVNGAPVHAGSTIRIMFTQDLTGTAGTGLILKYNGINVPVMIGENGNLEAFTPFDAGGTYKYVNAYTTLEMVYDGTQFIVTGNSEAAASAQQTIITTSSDNSPYSQRVNADKDKSFINKLIGASFAVNQLVKNGNFASTSEWSYNSNRATFSVSGNVGKMSNYQANNPYIQQARTFINGHKYLASIEVMCNQSGGIIDFGLRNSVSARVSTVQLPLLTTSRQLVSAVFVADTTVTTYCLEFRKSGYDSSTEVTFSNANLIDLTQMFGSAIADRIYAMEQATEGSGIAWIKSFGFFNNAYYSTNEGSIQSVKPSAYKTTGFNLVRGYTAIGATASYQRILYADVDLRPYTTYCIGLKAPAELSLYFNEFVFSTMGSSRYFRANGNYQYFILKTNALPKNTDTYKDGLGWVIVKNSTISASTANITDVCISLADSRFDGQYEKYIGEWNTPLADTELRGIPKLDSNNNLYFDGDVYYPNGDVIRRYGVATVSDFTENHLSSASDGGLGYIDSSSSVLAEIIDYVVNNFNLPTKNGSAGWNSTEPCIAILSSNNGNKIRIYETLNMTLTQFQEKYANLQVIYKKLTPTKETVAGYSNPHTLIRKGIEEFVDNRTIALPVGHETEYAQLPKWMQDGVIFL